jgi:hypothetical protein
LRKEPYWAKVAGVFEDTTGSSVSYELLRRITAESNEFWSDTKPSKVFGGKITAETETELEDDDNDPKTRREY